MARQLKTYMTSIGFFDLAVAAPSMKAALEAWGVTRNLFHSGFAQETDDPKIVAATMQRPGVVLRRAVGSKVTFSEDAALPKELPRSADKPSAPREQKEKPKKIAASKPASSPKAQNAAVIEFTKEKARRDREREKEEGERAKQEAQKLRDDEQRQQVIDKAKANLDRARETHESTMREIRREQDAAERKADTETERWRREKEKLAELVRSAGR